MRVLRIDLLLFEGFDELDAVAPLEVWRAAAAGGALLEVTLVASPGEERPLRAAHGLRLEPEAPFLPERRPDLLLVPGGGWIAGGARGVRGELERGVLPAVIAALHRQGTTIAAVCTGALLLGAAGILAGRPAVTHRTAREALLAAGATWTPARVVDDGDVITAGGVTSGLDLALWVLERWIDPATALRMEVLLEHERRGTVWRRPEAARMPPPAHHG
ncbi:MAG: DJ-1/PfpI family protein [Synechococcus sp.]